MFGLSRNTFIGLLTNIVTASNHTKCVLLNNKKCMTQPTPINLHPNEYSQKLHYYPLAVNLDGCAGSCNSLHDLSNKICIPNKTEDLNLSVFNMITGINESKTLTKHISCTVNVNLMVDNVIQIKSGIMINVGVNVKIQKNIIHLKRLYLEFCYIHAIVKMINI